MARLSDIERKISLELEVISYCNHEAGHVLCALLQHCKITSVQITYTQSVEGTTYYSTIAEVLPTTVILDDQEVVQKLALDEVRVLYAGLIAERMCYRDMCGSNKYPAVLQEGCSSDIKSASEIIKKYNLAPPGKKRQALKQKLQRDLSIQMKEHFKDLKLISHLLYKRKRISFDDLKTLLTKKSDNRTFWKQRLKEIGLIFDNAASIDNAKLRDILAV